MKKLIPILLVIFIILSLMGAAAMMLTKGALNPWIAILPTVVTIFLLDAYHRGKR